MAGFRVPGFDVDALLSRGWGGELWSAHGRATGRPVVLRRLEMADDVPSHDRVRRAAARLVGVDHPHLVGLRGVLSAPGAVVLVHDHVPGVGLDQWLADHGSMTAAEVVTLVGPLAEAVAALHAQGICHGRVSASSVVLGDDGRPMLADAGVAVLLDGLDRPNGPADDVRDLALTCAAGLSPSAQGSALASVLRAATVTDVLRRPTAAVLAAAIFATGPAAPIGSARGPSDWGPPGAGHPDRGAPDSGRGRPAHSHRRPVRRRAPVGRSPRWVALLAAAAAVTAAAALTGLAWAGADPGTSGSAVADRAVSTPPTKTSVAGRWRAVLVSLDARRASAFATASPRRLAGIYAPGAPALRRDEVRLAELTGTGLHVDRLHLRPQAVRVESGSSRRVVLDVVDVLEPYELRTARGSLAGLHPGRAATSWRVTLVRVGKDWRVFDVVAAGE